MSTLETETSGLQVNTNVTGGGSVAVTNGKTLTVSNSLTLAGTDGTTMTFPSTSQTVAAKPVITAAGVASASTSSTTSVMAGLAGAITPAVTGRVFVLITGYAFNSTISDGVKTQIAWGTGTAPIAGATATGTAVGQGIHQMSDAAANQTGFFTECWIISGLTLGTAIWIDLQLGAVTGGTANLNNINIVAFEL